MSRLAVSLLGPFQVTLDDANVHAFRADKVRALLAYLAVEDGRPHRRDALAGLLWPEMPDRAARDNLRLALHRLRQALHDTAAQSAFLELERESIALRPGTFWLDAAAFEALLAGVEQHDHPRRETCQPCMERLATAAGLYRGEFLQGFYLDDAPEFSDWATARRTAFHRVVLATHQTLVAYYQHRGELGLAEAHARRQLELEPWHETAHRQLMEMLARGGRFGAAARQFAICRRLLADELGVAPEEQTVALHERLQAAAARPAPNLPVETTSFVGREADLTSVDESLADPDCRLLTITGGGGVGKTRLALRAAGRIAAGGGQLFLHGVAFAPLVGVDAQDLPAVVGANLGLAFAGQEPAERQLLRYLQDKELLLVLDNYEHLLPETRLVETILQGAPDVKLLVTSRERLGLQEEWLFEAEGLPYPPAAADRATLADYDAVRLFANRAARVRRDFSLAAAGEAVAEVTRLVQGLPLALELAAAWLGSLTPAEVAAEVGRGIDFLEAHERNLPERHRSLRAVFRSSWARLSTPERQALAALSVFRGGFTREAAAEVTGATVQLLSGLTSKSLIRLRPSGRFEMHELLRQYAAKKLAEKPDRRAAAETAFTDCFLALAEEADARLQTSDQLFWLTRLETEHSNLRAALQWAQNQANMTYAARLTAALGNFWEIRGYLDVGNRWIDLVLASREKIAGPILAKMLYVRGLLAFEAGDYAIAEQRHEDSLSLWREIGDANWVGRLLDSLAHIVQQQGDLVRAEALGRESIVIHQEAGDKVGLASSLNRLGHIAQLLGDDAEATQLLEQSVALRRESGDQRAVASSLNALAQIARRQGVLDKARALYREGLDLCRQLGDKRCIAGISHNLGHVALQQGDFDRSRALFEESLGLYRELENGEGVTLCLTGLAGVCAALSQAAVAGCLLAKAAAMMAANNTVLTPADRQDWERIHAEVRGQLSEEEFAAAWAEGQAMALEDAIKLAMR